MKVLFRLARESMLLWFGAAFLAGGLVCLLMGLDGVMDEQQYQNEARIVQAIVLAKSIKPASREGNSSTSYDIVYRFMAADGTAVEGTDAVDVETWEGLEPGSRVGVTYLPANPRINRAASSGRMESALVAIVLGSIFALIGGYFLLRNASHVWRQWSILRHGATAQGTILAIEPTSTEINNVRQWEVRYRYRDFSGRVHEGTSGDMAPAEARAFAVGDTVKVRFHRRHPAESVWAEPEASADASAAATHSKPESTPFWKRLVNLAVMLALVFVVLVIGEIVIPITGLDDVIARHEGVLGATTLGMTAFGFALFMGGIIYRIISGPGEPMGHADVEDLLRSTRITRGRPYFLRASTYRFKGLSVGSSFHDEFSIKEAKQAWQRRAWRDSVCWRGNFVIMGGVLLFSVGLFGIFVVIGSNGIKLLSGGAITYAMARTATAFTRA